MSAQRLFWRVYPGMVAVMLLSGLFLPRAVWTAPVELLKDGGFEQAENGAFKEWIVNNAGVLTPAADARTGKTAVQFEAKLHEWGYCAFKSEKFPVNPKATYRMSVWAKGTGSVTLQVYQYSQTIWVGTNFITGELQLTPEWKKLEVVYKPTDNPIIAGGMFAISLFGEKSVAYFDDASLTFDPAENSGISSGLEAPVTTDIKFIVAGRNAKVHLYVAGKEVPMVNGAATVQVSEGLIPICVTGEATGDAPGVSVAIAGHPETDGRWKVGTKDEPRWTDTAFDDRLWKQPATGTDGYIWTGDSSSKTIFLRQLVLWNKTHYGPNRCIAPQTKEWGFSRKGMETFHWALYSPLTFPLSDYEIVFEVPAEFRLLDKSNYVPRYVLNNRPVRITTEEIQRDRRSYRRYRMFHAAGEVTPDKTDWTMLPFKMNGTPSYETCNFYYQRRAQGNFTELTQTIPVRILPAVNGKQPAGIKVFYHFPLSLSTLSPEHLETLIQQDAAAGINAYAHSPVPWMGTNWHDFEKLFYNCIAKANSKFILWPHINMPLNYGVNLSGASDNYHDWLVKHPAAHARFYNDTPQWGTNDATGYAYCTQYVLTDDDGSFDTAVRDDYTALLADVTDKDNHPLPVDTVFLDWEYYNINPDGTGTHCFCDRCKTAFRTYANLPADLNLTDQALVEQYREKWLAFRNFQDSEIQKKITEICHALGKKYMVYSWAHNSGFWDNCRGKIDIPFPGYPGFNPAGSHLQKTLDDQATYYGELGFKNNIVGQQFQFLRDVSKDGWKNVAISSHSGLVEPQNWKSQILRIVTAFHGGVDLSEGTDVLCAGVRYWIGEATRILAEYENLFARGERADALASSGQIAYPNLLVLKKGNERLVLLFNEGDKPLPVVLANAETGSGQTARIYGTGRVLQPEKMNLVIPANDVTIVHIR
ncbi:MAG: hypothetical protein ABII89_00615 [Candidatus Omnitrophota bacterium]